VVSAVVPILTRQAQKLENILNETARKFVNLDLEVPSKLSLKAGSGTIKAYQAEYYSKARSCFENAMKALMDSYVPFGIRKIRQQMEYACRILPILSEVPILLCELTDPPQVLTADELKLALRWKDWLLLYDQAKDVHIPPPPSESYSAGQRLKFHRFLLDFVIRWGLVVGYIERKVPMERAAASVSSSTDNHSTTTSGGSGDTWFSIPPSNASAEYLTWNEVTVKRLQSGSPSEAEVGAISAHGELLRRLLETDSYLLYIHDLGKLKQPKQPAAEKHCSLNEDKKEIQVGVFDEQVSCALGAMIYEGVEYEAHEQVEFRSRLPTRLQHHLNGALFTMVSHVRSADTLLSAIYAYPRPLGLQIVVLNNAKLDKENAAPIQELLHIKPERLSGSWATNTYNSVPSPNIHCPLPPDMTATSSEQNKANWLAEHSQSLSPFTTYLLSDSSSSSINPSASSAPESSLSSSSSDHQFPGSPVNPKELEASTLTVTFRKAEEQGTVHPECLVILYLMKEAPNIFEVSSICNTLFTP
jgi:hypothetical protein